MDSDDAILVERTRAGDAEAFRTLVERYSAQLFRVAYRIVGDVPSAEDAVQETFLRTYRALDRFDDRAQFRTWLFRIAVNTAIEILRKHQRQRSHQEWGEAGEMAPLPSHAPGPDRHAFSDEIERAVRGALTALTAVERAAFVLRHFEGRSIAEICGVLGVRENAGKQAIFRAVKKLRRVLEPLIDRRAPRTGREVLL